MESSRRDPGFTDDAFRRIMERAMELEQARVDHISETELRAISRELGVSLDSITRAIEENRGRIEMPVLQHAPVASTSWKVHVVAFSAGVGGAVLSLGSLRGMHGFYSADMTPTVAVFTALQMVAVVIAARYRGPARYERFQLTNIALWTGVGMGWLYLGGLIPEGLGASILASGLRSAAAGVGAIWLIDLFRNSRSQVHGQPPVSGSRVFNAVLKPLQKLRSWLHMFLPERGLWSMLHRTISIGDLRIALATRRNA